MSCSNDTLDVMFLFLSMCDSIFDICYEFSQWSRAFRMKILGPDSTKAKMSKMKQSNSQARTQ